MNAHPFRRLFFQSTALVAAMTTAGISHSAVEPAQKRAPSPSQTPSDRKPRWLLKDFIYMVEKDPARLLTIGEKLFSDERLRMSALEPSLAHEWQHRLAVSTSLSELFNPELNRKNSNIFRYRLRARKILSKALSQDPSLLVRDGTVESLRRIFKMNAAESKNWKAALEQAFLSEKNILDGEGFFIRETILTTFKEARIKPAREIILAASRDKNQEVRTLGKDSQLNIKRKNAKRRLK